MDIIINQCSMPINDETRLAIYSRLKKHLDALVPPMVVKENSAELTYELSGNKAVPYGHDKKIVPGMYFCSVAQRKDSVVFYFFPMYYNPAMNEVAPALCKCLKGKTCFHFKKEEQVDEKELAVLLKKGMEAWKERGYLV